MGRQRGSGVAGKITHLLNQQTWRSNKICSDSCCHQDHTAELAHHHEEDVVCVDHVSFAYGPQPILEQITMHVPNGVRLGIIGPNGGGKTTLIKIMVGLLKPDHGKVTVLNTTPREACHQRLVGYVPQKAEVESDFPLSVRQVVSLGLGRHSGWKRSANAPEIDETLNEVNMLDLADRAIGELSGGQQQRVFIARALVSKPRLLILDEPLIGVDQAGQQRFADLIKTIHTHRDLTVIMVSHDLRAVAAGCDRVACLSRRLHFHDAPDGLTPEVLNEVFSHDIAGVFHTGKGCEHDSH